MTAPPDATTSPFALSLAASTSDEMKDLGRRLGAVLAAGDVVGLVGPLGAGKTTLTQGIAEGLGVSSRRHVASPTFALVNEHPGRVALVHVDLYRVRDASELRELGLDETFDRAAVVIEWIDRFPDAVPADHLGITIAFAPGDGRHLSLRATGRRSARLLAALSSAAPPSV